MLKPALRFLFGTLFVLATLYPLESRAVQPSPAASTAPLTIAVTTTNDQFRVGAPIPAQLVITNISGSTVVLHVESTSYGQYYGYRFSLTLDGKEVPKTPFHRAIRREPGVSDPDAPGFFNAETYSMKAGQVAHVSIDIRKLFLITEPGTYQFSVGMHKIAGSRVEIPSKPVEIIVAP